LLKQHKQAKRWFFFLICLFTVGNLASFAAKRPQVPPKYTHWLNEEVNYLIADQEKEAFLDLTTDEDRETFIQNFWKIRNPDPDAPTNTVKEEHYSRLEYANANFGNPFAHDGWHTDRGMVYITLGPPQQRAKYPNTKYLRQMEIWFYQSPGPGLAPYFSVIFYKPSAGEDYRLYSPYGDRPEKLIASTNAINDQAKAVHIIDTDLGAEVARLSLSLLPDEPVDVKEAYPSLQSDVLLGNIRNYRNLPANRELLDARRSLEGVSHRVLLGEDFSDMFVLATRDGEHQASLHYLFRFLHPQDFSLTQQPDGRYYYALTAKAEVLGPDSKPVYTDSQEIAGYLSSQEFADVKAKCFGIEGRLPIAPGKYQLHLEVTNKVTRQSFTQTRAVLVPGFDRALGLSQAFFAAVANPERDPSGIKPYSFSGVKLPAIGSENTVIAPGAPLRLIYQMWDSPAEPESLKDKTIEVSYLIGQLGLPTKQKEEQAVARSSFNREGNLLMGKDLSTIQLHPGNYRLVITATDPETHETASEALNFQLSTTDSYPLWTVISPSYSDSKVSLYRRGICALAQKNAPLAAEYLKQAVQTDPANAEAYHALASAYRLDGDQVAAATAEKEGQKAARGNVLKPE